MNIIVFLGFKIINRTDSGELERNIFFHSSRSKVFKSSNNPRYFRNQQPLGLTTFGGSLVSGVVSFGGQ